MNILITLTVLLFSPSLLIASPTDHSWETSFGVSLPTLCLFSDSGLGQNEDALGRRYCSSSINASLQSKKKPYFVRASRSLLFGSDGESEGNEMIATQSQEIYINSIFLGPYFSLPKLIPAVTFDLGLGVFSGEVKKIFSEKIADDFIDYKRQSFKAMGVALSGGFQIALYEINKTKINLRFHADHFTTLEHTKEGTRDSMTALPAAEFSYGRLF